MTCGHTKLMPRRKVIDRRREHGSLEIIHTLSCGHRVVRPYSAKKTTYCEGCHAEQKAPCSSICEVSCSNRLLGTTCHSEAAQKRHQSLAAAGLMK